MAGTAQNQGMVYVRLKDWALRERPDLSAQAVAMRAIMAFAGTRGATVLAFPPPPVVELGLATGFDAQLVDFGNLGHDGLMAARNMLLGMRPRIHVWSGFAPTVWKIFPNSVWTSIGRRPAPWELRFRRSTTASPPRSAAVMSTTS